MEYISPDFEIFDVDFLNLNTSRENELPTRPITGR